MADSNIDKLLSKYNMDNYNITIENCHVKILQYIKDNAIPVNNYEEDMKNLYLNMLKDGYKFLINSDNLTDILISIAYVLSPDDELNSEMVKNTLGTMECDSSDEDEDEDNNMMQQQQQMLMNMMKMGKK
jgi:hypothetical protein